MGEAMKALLRSLAIPAVLVATLLLGACQDMGMKPMQQKSLYERLGGQGAITAVVDDFVGNVAADNRINKFFAKTDIPRLKRLLVEQICAGTGGPCTYTGRDMKSAHAGMGITDAQFNALVEDLVKSLDKFKVPEKEKGELLGILGPMKPSIVGQ
jgi:hemoglobin